MYGICIFIFGSFVGRQHHSPFIAHHSSFIIHHSSSFIIQQTYNHTLTIQLCQLNTFERTWSVPLHSHPCIIHRVSNIHTYVHQQRWYVNLYKHDRSFNSRANLSSIMYRMVDTTTCRNTLSSVSSVKYIHLLGIYYDIYFTMFGFTIFKTTSAYAYHHSSFSVHRQSSVIHHTAAHTSHHSSVIVNHLSVFIQFTIFSECRHGWIYTCNIFMFRTYK
jgi:hypothetical protein